ncbi:MAG: hypothetical protein M9890_01910 [Thermomicrobiales bacterium]|nr:hypothetical protein [Thermomicrobiales bacterium]
MPPRVTPFPGPVDSARQIFQIVREMSFDDLEQAALRRPRLAVVSTTAEDAQVAALDIFGPEASERVVALGEADPLPDLAEIILVEERAWRARAVSDARVVVFSRSEPIERVWQMLFAREPDIELALGRSFPKLRRAAAAHVVNATSRVNAQFAVVSNIPSLVPVVGGLLAAGADTIVLTKNQLMMIYKLAAIYGRDTSNRMAIYREMVPVVGAGLFWRTVARDMAAILPFAAGAVPKVLIAFTGTFVAGMAAQVYYDEGRRPSRDRLDSFRHWAMREIRRTPALLRSVPRLRDGFVNSDADVIDVRYTTDVSSEMP